jgi:hypothetical protein
VIGDRHSFFDQHVERFRTGPPRPRQGPAEALHPTVIDENPGAPLALWFDQRRPAWQGGGLNRTGLVFYLKLLDQRSQLGGAQLVQAPVFYFLPRRP